MSPHVVLLSDFGYRDAYAAVMRGAIVSYNPQIVVSDATHGIPPQSLSSAAYVLHTLLHVYPAETVFICVVDPGVGSRRRELVARIDGRVIVAPDNGLITLASSLAEDVAFFRVRPELLEELRAGKRRAATTFDGRDLFSPVGARIAVHGVEQICTPASQLSKQEREVILLDELHPIPTTEGRRVRGNIIHTDHFGNLISTIYLPDSSDADAAAENAGVVHFAGRELSLRTAYSDVARGEPLAYWGSFGFLEVAVREGSAARELEVKPSDPVILVSGQTDEE